MITLLHTYLPIALCIVAPIYHILMLYCVIHQAWLGAIMALYAACFSTYWGITLMMSRQKIRRFLLQLLLCILCSGSYMSQRVYADTNQSSHIVARIHTDLGTIEISQSQFLSYWKSYPHQDAETVLQILIDFELLVQQAYALKLDQSLVSYIQSKSVMIQHYLQQTFEPQWSIQQLPQNYVDLATKQNLHFFRHPELRNGAHILLMPDRTITERPELTVEDQRILSQLIKKVEQDLNTEPPQSQSEFQKRVERYHAWMPKGYRAHFEFLQKFARHGTYVESFSEACFKVTQAKLMTGVIETNFGYHIAWIEEVIAAKDQSDASIEQQVRQKIVPEVRQLELQKLLHHLAKKYPVQRVLHPSSQNELNQR